MQADRLPVVTPSKTPTGSDRVWFLALGDERDCGRRLSSRGYWKTRSWRVELDAMAVWRTWKQCRGGAAGVKRRGIGRARWRRGHGVLRWRRMERRSDGGRGKHDGAEQIGYGWAVPANAGVLIGRPKWHCADLRGKVTG